MLLVGSELIDIPIMSLQTGVELARTTGPVINPHKFTVAAYEVDGPTLDTVPSLLLVGDIRELGDIGMIIDSSDEFVGTDDVIKVKELYELSFELIGKLVVDQKGEKLGKVIDYSIRTIDYTIEQLHVKRPLFKSLNDSELLIHRSLITEVTDDRIIVKSAAQKVTPLMSKENYVNPFRSTTPQSESPRHAASQQH